MIQNRAGKVVITGAAPSVRDTNAEVVVAAGAIIETRSFRGGWVN